MHHPVSHPDPLGIALPVSDAPCPPANDPEAILRWLYSKHLQAGRIEPRREHADPFWRRIAEKRHDRRRLAASLRADPERETRLGRIAGVLGLDLSGLDLEAQIETVVRAFVPMRYHISGELELLGELERAAEVLVATY
ncbi:MAG: hypothetical protein RMK84_07965 [Oscillochloridaceae bacterium]|nr:hypothetical protein [Chloroflexaceae bacterium]MDW8390047.1 hypothetical protein [Oscillochloridaceae bacterium]